MAEQRGRLGRWARIVGACAVLFALGGYLLVLQKSSEEGPFRCVVEGGEKQEPWEMEPQMIRNAATIEAVAAARGLPDRAVTIALATAMQESMLRNIDYGDKDSVGLFQQRPSQGWGTVEQIMDPVYSAEIFYARLVEIPDYAELELTDAAQRVQRSAFPQAYAKHESRAALLTTALSGRAQAGINCSGKREGEPVVGDAAKVRAKLEREHGKGLVAPSPGAGESGKGGADQSDGGRDGGGSGGNDERESTLRIQVPRDDAKGGSDGTAEAEATRRGWQLAHWSLANASHLGVGRIAYDGYVWDAATAGSGWQRDKRADGDVRLTLTR
ncbi:hypothetical protein MTQ01_08470 [Streptomyces sp. XM4193]|uniref:hypothetical protein n=1 Tax=Streptomyces sp. XM4193 TaxID=2929782 RepID=UPI001FF8CB08|nr:hypothetical protein [Streptomyces sp. XM4193]MCK1796037.1 hypothetical protein [Streptomyces sp. XM4193]